MKHGISTSFNRRNHGSDNGHVIRIFAGEFNLRGVGSLRNISSAELRGSRFLMSPF